MIKDIFALFGLAVVGTVIAIILNIILDKIKDSIAKKRWNYRVKHRFDTPPTAKCYCVDCQCYEPIGKLRNGRCCKFNGWGVADNWFCWAATPKIKAGEQE